MRDVQPPVPGLSVAVVEGGARLRLDNATAHPVDVRPPEGAARSTEPLVPAGSSAAWADPRLGDPPADSLWAVPLLIDGQVVTVHGDRVWPPVPAPAPWWALTAAAALGTFSLGGTAALRRRDDLPHRRFDLAVGGVALAVVAAHVLHVVGSALVAAEPPTPGAVLAAAGLGVLCWVLGVAGAVLALARQPLALPLCASAGALAALLTAFDTAAFARPVLAFGWSFDLDRASTAVAFGAGLGLLVVGWTTLPVVREFSGHSHKTHARPQPSS